MIDLNSGSGATIGHRTISDAVNEALDRAMLARQAKAPKRHYLGASILGHECGRRLCYEYAGTERDETLTAKQIRIFDTGHALEDAVIDIFRDDDPIYGQMTERWMKEAGFVIETRDSRGEQFGFSALDGKLQGHIDGAIIEVPWEIANKFPPMPGGLEIKGLGLKWWNKAKKHGVKVGFPQYYSQVQTYMGYLDLTWFLFTATNKNTSEMHHEIVEYDPACAQRLSDRGLEVITAVDAGHLLERCATNADYFVCKFCPFAKRCWRE